MEYVFEIWSNNELNANEPLPTTLALDAIQTYLKAKAGQNDYTCQ